MAKYLFNYEATVEVIADTEEDAREKFFLSVDDECDIIDSDVMLVEVYDAYISTTP